MTAALHALVDGAAKFGPREERAEPNARDWPDALDLDELAKREPEAPKSIMEGVPTGYATGINGHGGAGKSQIELMRAVCIAAGVPFCGYEVARRKVLFLSCEDRTGVLHWRLTRICRYLGIDLASLNGWLEIIDLVGHDSILFNPDRYTGNAFTAAYGVLAEHMRQHENEVLVMDGIADTFGGNENSRGEVKQYINSLLALIPPDRGAVILIGHVNKATAGNGTTTEGYSGSTSWHNSCRARWYLYHETEQSDESERHQRTGKLIFELQKSNHGEIGTQIEFQWDADAHLFVGTRPAGEMIFDRKQRDREEQAGILRALAGCAASVPPIIVPAAMLGPRTAFHVLSLRPEFPETLRAGRAGIRRFRRQIEELRQSRTIAESEYRRTNRHLGAQLKITEEGMRQCAI